MIKFINKTQKLSELNPSLKKIKIEDKGFNNHDKCRFLICLDNCEELIRATDHGKHFSDFLRKLIEDCKFLTILVTSI